MDKRIFAKRLEVIAEQERVAMEEHGWVVHYVYESKEDELNGMANLHTHGLFENFRHRDLQVILPIQMNSIHPIFSLLAQKIKKDGVVFEPDVRYSDVLEGFDVLFKVYNEGDREVLRLLLPDPNGKLPIDKDCDRVYQRQLIELPF